MPKKTKTAKPAPARPQQPHNDPFVVEIPDRVGSISHDQDLIRENAARLTEAVLKRPPRAGQSS